ncbi:hypothetical protein K2173_004037 [Erythroxylum novogranatense]|uniref:Uncharacterized protein n=1 Tax=Erythroxylum novogranatense TaxID=1862640 RepID=A0AAV8SK91_9ROSI|nr:hypothetical protein K2173_004037 [Erythroxylum novogranatense]
MSTTPTASEASPPLPITAPDQAVLNKVIEEGEPMEKETVCLPNESDKVENPIAEELLNQQILVSNSDNKLTELPPTAVAEKTDEDSVVNLHGEDKVEGEKASTPASLTAGPEADVIISQPVDEQPSAEYVVRETIEKPEDASQEKVDKDNTHGVNATESSIETTNIPLEQSVVSHVNKSEAVLLNDVEDSVVSKQVEKPEEPIAFEVKTEEKSEVAEEEDKTGTVEAIEKPKELVETLPTEESGAVVPKHAEESELAGVKSGHVPSEPEVRLEEQSEVTKQGKHQESVDTEGNEKPDLQSESDKQVEITSRDEKSEPTVSDVESKSEGQTEVTDQVETKNEEADPKYVTEGEALNNEKELVGKVEGDTSIKIVETVTGENGAIAEPVVSTTEEVQDDLQTDKTECDTLVKEVETIIGETGATAESVVSTIEEIQVELQAEKTESSPPIFTEEKISKEDKDTGTDERHTVEVPPLKEVLVEAEKIGEEKQVVAVEAKSIERNEDVPQLNKVEDVKLSLSNTEVAERSMESEKGCEDVEVPALEGCKENIRIGLVDTD